MKNLTLLILKSFLFSILFIGQVSAGAHSDVRLLSSLESISEKTKTIQLGLEFKIAKKWHIYWKNPGEVGFPPKLKWTLDPFWKASELFFPVPTRISVTNGPDSFGYKDSVVFPLLLTKNAGPVTPLKARLRVDYLICDVQCIPESADLEISLPLGEEKKSAQASIVERAFKRLPKPAPHSDERKISISENAVILDLKDLDQKIDDVFVAPINSKEKLKVEVLEGNEWKVSGKKQVGDFEWTAVWKAIDGPTGVTGTILTSNASKMGPSSLKAMLFALLFAFLGGVILNLMPCVLPIVFLKTVSLLKLRDEAASGKTSLALTVLGILTSFLCLALFTIAVQRTGAEVGWGFQFQNHYFIMAMILAVFLFALSLFDVFQFSLTSKQSSRFAKMEGPFFEGVFATLLATPCSAPFLGAALSYALFQPAGILILFYLVMGLGLSLPYLVLMISPQLLQFLPKPGAWMERLKYFLGYSLILAALWLLYILHQQTANLVIFFVLLTLLGVYICLREIKSSWRWLAVALMIGLCFRMSVALSKSEAPIAPLSFSAEALQTKLDKGEKLFIIVTADWCLTCKYNEKVVTDREWFKKFLSDHKIQLVVYDWTQRNPEIGNFLKKYDRVGIPFSMFVSKEKEVVLPELLSQSVIEEYFQKF